MTGEMIANQSEGMKEKEIVTCFEMVLQNFLCETEENRPNFQGSRLMTGILICCNLNARQTLRCYANSPVCVSYPNKCI